MGELGDIGVADLLYLLGVRRHTGKLAINANADEVNLYVSDGQLVFVTSTNAALRLGRTFLRLGVVNPDQLQEALQEQDRAGGQRPLGNILLSRGWITADQLTACIEEQCIDVLARVIATEHGIFAYSNGVRAPRRTEIVPLNADRILMEAMHRTDELATLRRLLPLPTAPLVLSHAVGDVADALTDAEVLVAATLVSGAGSLAELADRMPMDEVALWRTVLSMRERGLLIAGHGAMGADLAVADNGTEDLPDLSSDAPPFLDLGEE